MRQRLLLLLHQKGHTLENVKMILGEMIGMMDKGDSEQTRFESLVSSLERGDEKTEMGDIETKETAKPSEILSKRSPSEEEKRIPSRNELKERIALKKERKRLKKDDTSSTNTT